MPLVLVLGKSGRSNGLLDGILDIYCPVVEGGLLVERGSDVVGEGNLLEGEGGLLEGKEEGEEVPPKLLPLDSRVVDKDPAPPGQTEVDVELGQYKVFVDRGYGVVGEGGLREGERERGSLDRDGEEGVQEREGEREWGLLEGEGDGEWGLLVVEEGEEVHPRPLQPDSYHKTGGEVVVDNYSIERMVDHERGSS